ncbi:MAG: DUF1543 domain-containing protein [Chitinophagaceae bacterium]|nr:MAG: DUF1543 domain-containing protein [Chitinophagaceae bacterium]
MNNLRLFMILIGAELTQRHTEQHDVYFGIGEKWEDLVPGIKLFWPDAKKLHVDAWRAVQHVEEFEIRVVSKLESALQEEVSQKLFFLNLGGYKRDEFNEFHYKMVCVAPDKAQAVVAGKKTAFFKHTSLPEAGSHVDDKYGIDVDDLYALEDIMAENVMAPYRIAILPAAPNAEADKINLGYFKFK